MKNFKIKFLFVFLYVIFLSVTSKANQTVIDINIEKDGEIKNTVELLLLDGMGYLKASDVSDIFEANLNYDSNTKEVTLFWPEKSNQPVQFTIGQKKVRIEGITRKMRKYPCIIEGTTYLPLESIITRAFESAVNRQVNWSFSERTLWISTDGNIADVRHYTYEKNTRFVVELTEKLEFEAQKDNGQLSLKIKQGKPAKPLQTHNINDGVLIKATGQKVNRDSIFTLFLDENAGDYNIEKFPSPLRLVIDIENTSPEISKIERQQHSPKPTGPAKRDKANLKEVNLIVLDPGHGGKDPGAIGPLGTKEKDIVLDIAKKAAQKIREELNIRVILTRSRDSFVPLSERVEIANKKDADLFISIHCNASFNPGSRGFETYFLSTEASDEEAAAVARRENAVMAMEQDGLDRGKVENILWSLTMNQFMNESSELCSFINCNITQKTGLRDRGVKQAGFHVLKGARMPGILLEAGFISNKEEEKKLRQEYFQEKIAAGLTEAIKEYTKWIKEK